MAESMFECDMQHRAISTCTDYLLERHYERWYDAVKRIIVRLTSEQAQSQEWYCLMSEPGNHVAASVPVFDICETCFIGMVETTGHVALFRKLTPIPPPGSKTCDFCSASERTPKYLRSWSQTLFTGDSRSFISYATRISTLPICARDRSAEGLRGWGTDDFIFCSARFEEVSRDSFFVSTFKYQNHLLGAGARCDMYTDNMRSRYITACRTKDLQPFIAYCHQREEWFRAASNALAQAGRLQQEKARFNNFTTGMAGLNVAASKHYGGLQSWTDGWSGAGAYSLLGSNDYTRNRQHQIFAEGQSMMDARASGLTAAGREILRQWKEME